MGSKLASLYLARLTVEDRTKLLKKLHGIQMGRCFICEKDIDLALHKDSIDIDHVVPLKLGGKDDESNFAVTHASCNRSKQASNLEVARILCRFKELKESLEGENRTPSLADILEQAKGGKASLKFIVSASEVSYSFGDIGDSKIRKVPLYEDGLSGFKYFFAQLPIEYMRHDDRINPRSIGANISKLVEEFYHKRPQLHVPLAWVDSKDSDSPIFIFDGQHKAAAQIMLGERALPLRVFVDPDLDVLITTNTNAGTTLRQVAFDKSIQRHLGSTLYQDRINRFRKETGRGEEDLSFSERDLVGYFKGQSREMKRYILDAVRDGITSSADNKLRDFIDYGGRGKERPLSYSSIDKTFYSFFIHQEVLDTPLDHGLENGENPRELETSQIIKLMNLIAEEIFIGKFDADLGTDKIENRIQRGELFPIDHVTAFRLSKEEVIYNWLSYIRQVAEFYFINSGKPIQKDKLFQYPFPEQIWQNIRNFLRNFANLPLWSNNDLSATVFGGKQNNSFWQNVFETGRTTQGVHVMPQGINLVELIR